jgi:hypothetical protein
LAASDALTDEEIEHELYLQQKARDAEDAAPAAQTATARTPPGRDVTEPLLTAYDAGRPLEAPLADLRVALAKPARALRTTAPRTPRQGTKQQAVLDLLRQPEGASVAQVIEATG